MNEYKQFILDIIINRGRFAIPDTEYTEVHHIIPECMGGTSEKENLVQLYAREHLVAHKLLADIYPCHNKVQYAFNKMLDYKRYDGALSPAEYERAKKKKSEAASEAWKGENNPAKARSKPVEALDPESGQRVFYFKSTNDASRAGFHQGHVSECCTGKHKTHSGYIWRYVEEVSDNDSDN